jgi:hypothetical protein
MEFLSSKFKSISQWSLTWACKSPNREIMSPSLTARLNWLPTFFRRVRGTSLKSLKFHRAARNAHFDCCGRRGLPLPRKTRLYIFRSFLTANLFLWLGFERRFSIVFMRLGNLPGISKNYRSIYSGTLAHAYAEQQYHLYAFWIQIESREEFKLFWQHGPNPIEFISPISARQATSNRPIFYKIMCIYPNTQNFLHKFARTFRHFRRERSQTSSIALCSQLSK